MYESDSGAIPGATVIASVKWYNPAKGFGFLTPADGSGDIFCHASALGRAGWETLPVGATVTCEVVEGRQGLQVWQIQEVDTSTASPDRSGTGKSAHGERNPEFREQPPAAGRRLVATVKWFVPAKGFGFLAPVDGSADVFCHASVVESAGYETLPTGASVTCDVVEEKRGPAVSSIIAVDTSTAMSAPVEHNARRHGAPQYGRHHDAAAEERRGVVKFYDAGKGFGFVVPDDGDADVFLHASVLDRAGLDALEEGQQVSVMVTQGRRGPQATDIQLL